MKSIYIGTNLIEDCANPLVISGIPLFSYKSDSEGIKITFNVSSPPANTTIQIEENKVLKGSVNIKIDKKSAVIRLGDKNIFELIVVADDSVKINLDLRPIGLLIYNDENTLYVGGARLSSNVIKNCTNGIAIGG